MVKITKVYTKLGDKGQTSLASNHSVAKSSEIITVIGEIDELNSYVGFASVAMQSFDKLQELSQHCYSIQNWLFDLGAQFAVLEQDRKENTPSINSNHISWLEHDIDNMNLSLPILKSFILPGGCEISARLHLARVVCRRAERSLVKLLGEIQGNDNRLIFINRMSDWLFVAARYVAYLLHEKELLWQPNFWDLK